MTKQNTTVDVDHVLYDIERRNDMVLKLTSSVDTQLEQIRKYPEEKVLFTTGHLDEIDLLKDCIYEIAKINQSDMDKVHNYFNEMEV